MSDDHLKRNDSAAHAPEEVLRWVRKFQEAHQCPMTLSREASGYHLYLPCPDCLHTHGRRELSDPKYAINLSMLAGLGDEFRDNTGHSFMPSDVLERMQLEKRREWGSGVCMRTRSSSKPHRFSIDELIHMGTVTERHPDILTKAGVSGAVGTAEQEDMWEEDPVSGKKCPPPPGDTVPISSLPPDHPAVAYLTGRGFDPVTIQDQFRLSFCVKEYPYGQKQIFYRKMPGGWKDTPQHRIIFYSLVDGVPMTWQARVIERVDETGLNRFMLHPYAGGFYPTLDVDRAVSSCRKGGFEGDLQTVLDQERGGYWVFQWSHTHTRANPKMPWQPVPPFDEVKEDGNVSFKPSKYRTAKYSSRHLMGWDAAIKRAAEDPHPLKWCVVLEGPLDGARTGPGGIPLIGSSISPENAAKIATNFHIVFLALDADKAGRDALEKLPAMLMESKARNPLIMLVAQIPLPAGADVGELSQDAWSSLFDRTWKRVQRQLS